MFLNNIEDPRDPLQRAKRRELVEFAHQHGHTHITTEMPAIYIRNYLRAQGLTNIRVPNRPLGQPPKDSSTAHPSLMNPQVDEENVQTLDADADLARQFGLDVPVDRSDTVEPEKPKRQPKNMTIIHEIAALRRECKKRGIKMAVHDTRETLKAKLGGSISS